MIATCMLVASLSTPPGSWAGLSNTADTLDRGEWVVRLPTGRSAVGVARRTELWLRPYEWAVAGPRIGVEQQLINKNGWRWSLAPSVGEKWTLGRTSTRLDALVSKGFGRHQLHLLATVDTQFLRQTRLGVERSHRWSVDRVHVPVTVGYDHLWDNTVVRASLRVLAYDEGEVFTHFVAAGSWVRRWSWFYLELGAGVLVGRPSEHVFLGRYQHPLVIGYPKVDLWFQF